MNVDEALKVLFCTEMFTIPEIEDIEKYIQEHRYKKIGSKIISFEEEIVKEIMKSVEALNALKIAFEKRDRKALRPALSQMWIIPKRVFSEINERSWVLDIRPMPSTFTNAVLDFVSLIPFQKIVLNITQLKNPVERTVFRNAEHIYLYINDSVFLTSKETKEISKSSMKKIELRFPNFIAEDKKTDILTLLDHMMKNSKAEISINENYTKVREADLSHFMNEAGQFAKLFSRKISY